MYATASDPDGTIAKVEFYDGSSGELMPGTITVCMQGTPLKVTAVQRL